MTNFKTRKFLTPCLGDPNIFDEEDYHCKRCQNKTICKRLIIAKLNKKRLGKAKKPHKTISHLNQNLLDNPEYEGFEYGVDY